METLLDRHLATFDRWLQTYLMSSTVSLQPHYYLAVVTLLDQLDLKIFYWPLASVILQCQLPGVFMPSKLLNLFGRAGLNIEFIQIVSKFLTDRDRAGSLWVDSRRYAGLAMDILCVLCDKWVYNPYTLVRANMNDWIYYRRFIDIGNIHTVIPGRFMAYYEVGRLAFNLLPILLSRIDGPAVSKVQTILLGFPTFHLIQNDPLGLEKVEATHAIEEFLKVWL